MKIQFHMFSCLCGVFILMPISEVKANNLSENVAWQFQTTADKVNLAFLEDLRQKKASDYYSAPNYNTTIDRQYNCNVAATAQGNQGSNSNSANSPATNGATTNSTGNSNDADVGGQGAADAANDQLNSGLVQASTNGSTVTNVHGTAEQALNSDQFNSGNQTASVEGATACQFAALN